jgi:hypothetical protein
MRIIGSGNPRDRVPVAPVTDKATQVRLLQDGDTHWLLEMSNGGRPPRAPRCGFRLKSITHFG